MRRADPRHAAAPGLSAAGDRRRPAKRDGVLSAGARGGRLRRGDRDGAERGPGEPAVPVPRRARPAGRRAADRRTESATSSSRRGCRSSSGAASRTTSCSTWPSAASCSKPEVLEQQVRRMLADPRSRSAGDQLRRPVAAPAQPGVDHARTCGCSPTSTTTCGRRSGRRRSCSSRASCARTAACSTCSKSDHTFLNERLARHYGIPHVYGSRFRRVALGDDSDARRPAAAGEHPDGDLLRDAHLAGDPRQVDPREPPRHAAAAAAAERAGAEGQHGLGDAARSASGWPSTAPTPPARAATS